MRRYHNYDAVYRNSNDEAIIEEALSILEGVRLAGSYKR